MRFLLIRSHYRPARILIMNLTQLQNLTLKFKHKIPAKFSIDIASHLNLALRAPPSTTLITFHRSVFFTKANIRLTPLLSLRGINLSESNSSLIR